MTPHDENDWTVEGPIRWREVTHAVNHRLHATRETQSKWEFYCHSCGLIDTIWVDENQSPDLDNCPGCGRLDWLAKPLTKTTMETMLVRNDCEQCGHHRNSHSGGCGMCVECDKLVQNGVCLTMGACYSFMEPPPLQVEIVNAGPGAASELSSEQRLEVDNKLNARDENLKALIATAQKVGKSAKETAETFGLSIAAVTKQFEELKPHMEKAKAEHERRKEFAMTLKGYIATWIKNQDGRHEKKRREAFSNGYRACVETGANARPGEAWTAYRAWLVRNSFGALDLRWIAWSAGWRTAEDHYKRKRAAAEGVSIEGSPIEYIDMDGNSHKLPPNTPFAEACTIIEAINDARPALKLEPLVGKPENMHRILVLQGEVLDHARADHIHPTHQEESDQSMIPAIRPDAHQLAEALVAAHKAPWVPKAGEIAYIKETFEGPFVLLERLNEETVITFLNPLQDSDDTFIAAKLPVGTKAWLVQPKTGKPRTILEPLLTNQKPPRGQFLAKLGGALSSRVFGALVQAAGFATLAYLLLR